eukprot:GDKH01005800.1.p1 GENE.GDKH01005800.1~~GDKH01005800.1.p1  ORF type:complete len:134 (-),score=17.19 GDKH01005800.1:168-569(-)
MLRWALCLGVVVTTTGLPVYTGSQGFSKFTLGELADSMSTSEAAIFNVKDSGDKALPIRRIFDTDHVMYRPQKEEWSAGFVDRLGDIMKKAQEKGVAATSTTKEAQEGGSDKDSKEGSLLDRLSSKKSLRDRE